MNASVQIFARRRCLSCRMFFTQIEGSVDRLCRPCREFEGRPPYRVLVRLTFAYAGPRRRFELKHNEVGA